MAYFAIALGLLMVLTLEVLVVVILVVVTVAGVIAGNHTSNFVKDVSSLHSNTKSWVMNKRIYEYKLSNYSYYIQSTLLHNCSNGQ